MKTIIKILLSISIVLLSYMCVMSILTPIRFDATKESREKVIIKRLTDIRKVELEYRDQKGRFTGSFDTLISFVKQARKKVVMKEGTLTDKQLDAGLTEAKAVKIVHSGNAKEIAENGLQGFVRDTAYVNMIKAVFPNDYTPETIDQLAVIPFSNNEKFTLKVKNDYVNSAGIVIPLFEASATYKSYLFDLNRQEMLNAIDLQDKLNKFPGLQVGSIDEPNNNAGNWE
ncbi:MAG: hypothetical protein WCS79_06140 [Paludibacter sp.]